MFDEYHLLTTADWRKDISPGATLKVTGREPDARTQTFVACQTNSQRRIGLQEEHFTDKACPVDKPIRAAAGINRTARSGWVAVERNSDRVRQSLLLELVARSVKIILRRASLQAAELCGYNSEESFKDIAVRPRVTYFTTRWHCQMISFPLSLTCMLFSAFFFCCCCSEGCHPEQNHGG